jgi:hypothetical protein
MSRPNFGYAKFYGMQALADGADTNVYPVAPISFSATLASRYLLMVASGINAPAVAICPATIRASGEKSSTAIGPATFG